MTINNNAEQDHQLPLRESKLYPIEHLRLDLNNPRLQTGSDLTADIEAEAIEQLADIAALDELVLSICTNKYLNLEPLIVYSDNGRAPYTVLEGNRRLAAIRLIQNPRQAKDLNIKIPENVAQFVIDSFREVLVYRVASPDDAREFIGFKHINGPQRWDAYAKAKYVTDWYVKSIGSISISEIAAKMGDVNSTLRAYIYAVLILQQADKFNVWSTKDKYIRGRFGFSHFYTALGREEFKEYLGLTEGWSDTPSLEPVKKEFLPNLGETLTYIYGSKTDDRPSLIRSQNPDLKDIGLAIANDEARIILKNRGTLDEARDALKDPADAFYDTLVSANIKLARAIELLPRYTGGREEIDKVINEIFERADTLQAINERKKSRNNS